MRNIRGCKDEEEHNRLDDIIDCLERLYADANDIFDGHCNELLPYSPEGTSLGSLKQKVIFEPAGMAVDYISALKHLNKKIRK